VNTIDPAKGKRRDPRYAARLRIVLLVGSREQVLYTEDISLQGLRVRTDLALPARQLLRLRLPIGENGAEVACQGMAVHADPSEVDGSPSVGIQFYAFDGAVREAWTRLVTETRQAEPKTLPPEPAVAVEAPVRRQSPRKSARVTVYIGSMDDLISFTTVNVSRGGMFLATSTPMPVGTALRLEMRNPDTHPFALEAVVRRVDLDHDPPGMAVEFGADIVDEQLEALLADTDDAPVFVTSYDPNLE